MGLQYDLNYGDPLLMECIATSICRSFKVCGELSLLERDIASTSESPSYSIVAERQLEKRGGGDDFIVEFVDFFGRSSFSQQLLSYNDYRIAVGPFKLIKKMKDCYHFFSRTLIKVKRKNPYYDEKITIKSETEIRKNLGKMYDAYFKDADLVLISGAGTLKYDVRLNFGPFYKVISEYAQKNNVPCVINAIGVESRYNNDDYRCTQFSKTLSNSIFKIISTRDDLVELKKYVDNPKTEIFKVADPGILASYIYNISKDNLSDTVGVGIIDYERFTEFHRGISRKDYIRTIIGIINNLNKSNQEWKLFTNGDVGDTMCAYEIAERLKVTPDKYVVIPRNPKNLVEIISSFKGLITSRLHSTIIAYSLNIPFVAISWNNKLSYFAENIGCLDRIFDKDSLNPDLIIAGLNTALKEGFDNERRFELSKSIENAFKQYLKLLEV